MLHQSSPTSSQNVTIVVDAIHSSSPFYLERGIFTGYQWESLRGKILRAGLLPDSIDFVLLKDAPKYDFTGKTIVGLGSPVLTYFTGKHGIDKWQLSPLLTKLGQKFIPTYSLDRTQKQFELNLYIELALLRAADESRSPSYTRAEERFLLNPTIEETLAVLEHIKQQPEVSVDVETGYGQINTVGFAWSPSDAIAINVLPDRCGDHSYYELWRRICEVMEGPSRKIFQNFIYDVSYFSAYGLRTNNISHDTMWAMKVLWPELKSNLGNVGRIYTKRPYWKDDGKATDEESGKRDWGAIRDWTKHYQYNCRDTTGTFEAAQGQRKDLDQRGLSEFFNGYVQQLARPVLEMCSNGMPLCLASRQRLKEETEGRIRALTLRLHEEAGSGLNYRSPAQVKAYIKGLGVGIPKKFHKESGTYKESTDASSIKKIQLKNPNLPALATLTQVKTLDTYLSRYINFETKPGESILRYSLNGCGTETLRMSGGTDPWDRGINIQTMPGAGAELPIKSQFVAPEGRSFIEVDLRQAESRFVAYDAADSRLIEMLETDQDVHSFVAEAILARLGKDRKSIPKDEFKNTWRQLGKKAGHGANYGMKANTFVETCFSEMEIVLKKTEAEAILEAYHEVFPGIRQLHQTIRSELNLKRKLTVPSGWERYFYGRMDDNTFREAYAFRAQHYIPFVTNKLMLHLCRWRNRTGVDLKLHVQVHDSLIMSAPDESLKDVALACAPSEWQEPATLAGGRLIIPIEAKAGKRMNELEEIYVN